MSIKGILITVFLLAYISPALADMPDCLSGICVDKTYTDKVMKSKGFSVEKSECRSSVVFKKSEDNVTLEVKTSSEKGEDKARNEPKAKNNAFYVKRELKLPPSNIERFRNENYIFVERMVHTVLDKYGHNDYVDVKEDNRWHWTIKYPDSDYFKQVRVFIWGKEEKITLEETIIAKYNFDEYSYIDRECIKKEKADDARSIIPD